MRAFLPPETHEIRYPNLTQPCYRCVVCCGKQADFARAAKVVSGQDLSSECIWVVFKMFDEGRDGRLQYEELLSATRDRVRRLPGQRESRDSLSQFMHCVRGD